MKQDDIFSVRLPIIKMKKMASMDDLPEEMIVHLMSYLSLPDRKNARLVCRRWRLLSYSVSLIKDDIIAVNLYSDLAKLSTKHKYKNLKIRQVTEGEAESSEGLNKNITRFWQICGAHVKSLELYQTDLLNSRLNEIFPLCPNLEYLLISLYDENDQSSKVRFPFRQHQRNVNCDHFKFPKLLSLDLLHLKPGSIYVFSDSLMGVAGQSPLLKRLSLEWFNPGSSHMPKEALISFAKKQGKMLKELNLSRTCLNDQLLQSMCLHIGPQLTGLYLKGCKSLSDESFSVIASAFPNLKELDLSLCLFSDCALASMLKKLQNVSHISLSKTNVGCSTIALMSERPKLVAVELSQCRFVTSIAIQNAFEVTMFEKLVDLRLDKAKLRDSVVQAICPRMPKLLYLYLNDCQALSDVSLSTICQFLCKLRSLSIRNWVKLTNVSCINKLKGLIHLDLYGCRKACNESLSNLNLLELQTVDLSGTNILSEGCRSLLSQCPTLQDMYVDIDLENDFKKLRHPTNDRFKFHFGLAHFTADSIFDS